MKMFRFFDPSRELNFVQYFRPSLYLAALFPVVAVVGSMVLGINWGIDFAGGMEMQVQFSKPVPAEEIRDVLEELGFHKHQVQRYGGKDSNEMLVRVERLSTFKPEDALRVQKIIADNLSTSTNTVAQKSIEVLFNENISDRFFVKIPAPKILAGATAEQAAEALQAQHRQLAKIIDDKSGFKLRKTKKVGEETADINNAVMHDEPKDGFVQYNIHFTGVSDKIGHVLSQKFGQVEIRRVEFVDSQVSKQLRTDGILAVFYAILAILIYIAIRFDVFFSPGAVVALIQDTFGAFLVFVFGRYEFDLPSIAALLTVVGVSVINTVVVYDRIRETMPTGKKELDNAEITLCVNKAVNDTLSRTINTTLTTLFSSIALWIFAGGAIQSFAITLTVGLSLGAFSSTFAAPATYLFLRQRFKHHDLFSSNKTKTGPTREDKARGVV
jgi:preprotein translocase subunit SecF